MVCCIIVALTLSFAMSDGYPCAAVAAPLLLGICWSVKCIYNLKEDNQKLQAELHQVQIARKEDNKQFQSESEGRTKMFNALHDQKFGSESKIRELTEQLRKNNIELNHATNGAALREARNQLQEAEVANQLKDEVIVSKAQEIKDLKEKMAAAQAEQERDHYQQVLDLRAEIRTLREQNAELIHSSELLNSENGRKALAFDQFVEVAHKKVEGVGQHSKVVGSILYKLMNEKEVDSELLDVNLGRNNLKAPGALKGSIRGLKGATSDKDSEQLVYITSHGNQSYVCHIPNLTTIEEAESFGAAPVGENLSPKPDNCLVFSSSKEPVTLSSLFAGLSLSGSASLGSSVFSGDVVELATTSTPASPNGLLKRKASPGEFDGNTTPPKKCKKVRAQRNSEPSVSTSTNQSSIGIDDFDENFGRTGSGPTADTMKQTIPVSADDHLRGTVAKTYSPRSDTANHEPQVMSDFSGLSLS